MKPRSPRHRTYTALALLGCMSMLVPGRGHGQAVIRVSTIGPDVAVRAEGMYNAAGTIRVEGGFVLPSGRAVQADLAVLAGAVDISGALEGNLLVINGDLTLRTGARITGTVVVMGGALDIEQGAELAGPVTVYEVPLRYRKRGADLVIEGEVGPASPRLFASEFGPGRAHLTVRAGNNYNRVEGLPVLFGPVFETSAPNPLRIEGLGIWRTNEGFSTAEDKLGFRIRAEKAFGGTGGYSLGATWYSQVEPIERQGLTSLEASLATFFLHRDYRDYYAREGWSVYGRVAFPFSPLVFRSEYRDERQRFAPVGGPWSLTDNDGPWRPQPLIGAGDLRSVTSDLTYDTRNSERAPTHGWLARLGVTVGLDGDLALPSYSSTPDFELGPVYAPTSIDDQFTRGSVELAFYSRLGPRSVLAVRAAAAGSLDGRPLPPQYQTALGGEGSLPGYEAFELACGARENTVYVQRPDPEEDEEPVVPTFLAYGCDRSLLVQLEYRSEFGGALPLIGDGRYGGSEWLPPIDFTPGWTVFSNFGRGWSLSEEPSGLLVSRGTRARTDVGVGLLLGGLGFYWAYPLEGEDRAANFFIRLTHRF